MNPRRPILLAVFCAAGALPGFAGSGHYPISREQIAATAASSGVQVSANDVSLLADVVATVRQPAMRMASVRPAPGHLLIARMECADPTQCIPFMVALRVDGSAPLPVVKDMEFDARPSPPATPLVHAGSTAILLLDGPHVHISLTVICLENGTRGQMIRAANPDRNHFYTVQVAGDRLLRGIL